MVAFLTRCQFQKLCKFEMMDVSFCNNKHYLRNKVLDQLEHIKSSNEGKLRFYSNICSSLDLKDYLKFNLARSGISLLTKIRVNAHSLAIETGRY